MNSVIITGRLTKDVELKYTQNNTAVAIFTVAVDRGMSRERKEEAKASGYPTADFINVVAYGKTAELCNKYTSKGKMILVNGNIQTRSYENKEGTRVYVTEVVAYGVEFLEFKDKNNNYGGSNNEDYNPNVPF